MVFLFLPNSIQNNYMKREFILNLSFLILINLMIKPLYIFGIDVGVQNAVGPERYGLYFYFLGFIYLFQFINDFGIQNFNNRFISLNEKLLGKYFPHILSIKLSLGLVFFSGIILTGWALGLVKMNPFLFGIIGLNLFLDSMNAYLRSNIAGLGWYRKDSFLSVTDKLIMIFLVGYLLLNEQTRAVFSIEWFALAQTISFFSVSLICLYLLRKKARPKFSIPDKKYFFLILRKSFPFALILISTFLYNRLDGVMIGYILEDGERQAGYYAAAYRLYDAATMLTFLFIGLLYPMFSKMLSRNEQPAELYQFGSTLLWILSLVILLIFLLFPSEIMNLLYLEPGPDAAMVLMLLGTAFVFKSIFNLSGAYLLAFGDLRKMNIVLLAGLMINFFVNLILIPKLGIIGACIATLATQFLVALLLFIRATRFSSGKMGIPTLLKGLAVFLITVTPVIYFQANTDAGDILKKSIQVLPVFALFLVIIAVTFYKNSFRIRKWLDK